MTVYIDACAPEVEVGRDIIWARLWADTLAEAQDFAARLDLTWPLGALYAVIAEGTRRRAIVMGAIPVHPDTHWPGPRGELSGVAA